jgi:hypothetical protein
LSPAEKLEQLQRSRHDPQAQSFRPSVSDGTGDYCLGGTAGAGEYLEEHTDFGDRMVGYNPTRGCVLLCSLGRSRWKVSTPVKWEAELCLSGL